MATRTSAGRDCESILRFAHCASLAGIVVDQNQALRFALDIARGMEFLHSMEPLIPNLCLSSKHVMVRSATSATCR